MNFVDKCPICGTTLTIETVEKLLKGGNHMASVKVEAGVCKKCGEMVFDASTHQRIESIRGKLTGGQFEDLTPIGRAFAA